MGVRVGEANNPGSEGWRIVLCPFRPYAPTKSAYEVYYNAEMPFVYAAYPTDSLAFRTSIVQTRWNLHRMVQEFAVVSKRQAAHSGAKDRLRTCVGALQAARSAVLLSRRVYGWEYIDVKGNPAIQIQERIRLTRSPIALMDEHYKQELAARLTIVQAACVTMELPDPSTSVKKRQS